MAKRSETHRETVGRIRALADRSADKLAARALRQFAAVVERRAEQAEAEACARRLSTSARE